MTEQSRLALAIRNAGLTQSALAKELNVSREAVSTWVRGINSPHPDIALALSKHLGFDNPSQLFDMTQDDFAMAINILKNGNLDRRQLIELLSTLPVFAGLDLTALLGAQSVAPEQFLSQCSAAINGCWQLMNSGGYSTVEAILTVNLPTLLPLATQASKYQELAASLATQAKIMQIRLATTNRDFPGRKALCLEAVQFAEISGDPYLYASAVFWHGDTYVYCYRQPQKAIAIFTQGLRTLNGDMPLNNTAISINLAIAHAQEGDENLALEHAGQAREAMPKYPEQDPAYRYVDQGEAWLEKVEGRMYLDLAQRSPGYARSAYNVLSEGANKFVHQGGLSQTLIHKANAAYLIGDLEEYTACLEEGTRLGLSVRSKNRLHEALTVYASAPEHWRKDQRYKELAPLFGNLSLT